MSENERTRATATPGITAGAHQPWPNGGRSFHPDAAPPGSGSGVPAITLGAVLHAVRRWWKWATPLGLLFGALAGGAVWYLFEPQYMASRFIRIQDQIPFIAFPQSGDSPRYARTQLVMIKSRIVLDYVVSRPDIAQLEELQGVLSPVDWIKDHIQTSTLENSEFYQVSFEGPNPDHAVLFINAIVDEYMEQLRSSGTESTEDIKSTLDGALERRKSEMESLRWQVVEKNSELAGEEGNIVLPDLEGILNLPSQLARLQSSWATAEVELIFLKANYKMLAGKLDTQQIEVSEEEIQAGVAREPQIQAILQQLVVERARLANREALGASANQDRWVKSYQETIGVLEQQLDDLSEEVQNDLKKAAEMRIRAEQGAQLAEVADQVETAEFTEKVLKQQVERQRDDLASTSVRKMDLEFLQFDLAQATEVHRRIKQRIESMETESQAPDRVLARWPAVQAVPTKTHKIPRILLASAAGLGFPFFLAVLWEMKSRRIGESDEISGETPIKVVGEISALPTRPSRLRRRSASYYYYRNTFEESVDYLRTSLLLSDNFHDMRVVAVASAVSREGKTSLASHLAVSVARAMKEPTLLIDADMRKPGIHDLFDVPLSPGLADLLEGQCEFEEALAVDVVPNLHILPAGQLSQSPHVLLANGALRLLLDKARSKYRYVIVDTPPVLPVSDALVIAKACDGTLISTMRDVSRGPQIRQACERLKAAGAHLIGAVLSGVPPKNYVSRYDSYSYHYQRYTGNQPPATNST